jgi:hypothetical protein
MKIAVPLAILLAVSPWLWCCERASAEVLKLKYQFETSIEQPPKPMVTEKRTERENKLDTNGGRSSEYRKEESTITLGDGHFYIESKDNSELYDFKSQRVSSFDSLSKTYEQHSLFVYCGFKDLEIRNRAMLSEVLEKVGMGDTKASVFDPFDVACELGMIMPDKPDNPGIAVDELQNGELLTFSYQGKIIAEALLGEKFDDAFAPMTQKVLLYKTSLHPFVREQVLAKGRYIKFLSYQFSAAMRKYSIKVSLMEKAVDHTEADYFEGYKIAFDKNTPLYTVQQKVMLDDNPIVLPTRDRAFGEAQKMVNQRRLTDAFLAVTEYNLTTGDRAEEDAGDIISEVKEDPVFKIISGALEPATRKEAEKALENLQGINSAGLAKGYIIEIFKANIADSLGLDASKIFLIALERNPHLTGVYNDLGRHYYSRYDSLSAWNSWDLARRVCPEYPMLDSVAKLEARLKRLHPEYF